VSRFNKILCFTGLVTILGLGGCHSTPGSTGLKNRIESRNRVEEHKGKLELQQAYSAYTTGQFDKALKLGQQARIRMPGNPSTYLLLARICLETGRLEACDRLIGEALKINETIPDAHYLRGVVYQRWSRDEQALDSYMTAWNNDPSSVQSVHYLLAASETLMDMGKYTQARDLLLPKLGYFENSAAMHHLLGTIAVLMKDNDAAIKHLEQASLIGGTDEIVVADLVRAQISAKRFRDCLRTLGKLEAEMGKETPTWVYQIRARCYHEMGSPREARAAYVELLRKDPDDIRAWIEYGATVHEIGDMKRLETCSDRLLALAPGRCEGYLYKGLIVMDSGNLDLARSWLTKAVDVAQDRDLVPLLALARVELLRGDHDAAFKRCQQVLLHDPKDVRARSLVGVLAVGSLGDMPE
jgi:tetratricopeptide (TPR) repeat protein